MTCKVKSVFIAILQSEPKMNKRSASLYSPQLSAIDSFKYVYNGSRSTRGARTADFTDLFCEECDSDLDISKCVGEFVD